MIIDFSSSTVTLPQGDADWQREILNFVQEYKSNEQIKVQTSGSTGKPKTYFLDKSAMQQSAQLTAHFLDLKHGDTALLCMPVQYIAGKMMIVRAIEIGFKLFCIQPKVQLSIPDDIDFGALTPMQAESSVNELNKIKKLILGGAKVSPKLEESLASLETTIYETYGMTETITHIAMRKLSKETYFHTLQRIHIRQDDRGCLVIKTPYFEEEIITNDLVEILDKHSFKLLGRVDNIINSGGIKINPEKIESLLKPYISQPFIIHYVPDEQLGQKLVLVIEGHPTKIKYPDNLLQKNHNPKEIYFVNQFPRTLSGKIKRNKIELP